MFFATYYTMTSISPWSLYYAPRNVKHKHFKVWLLHYTSSNVNHINVSLWLLYYGSCSVNYINSGHCTYMVPCNVNYTYFVRSTFIITLCNRKSCARYSPFVSGIHRSPMDSPHKGPVMRNFGTLSVVNNKHCKHICRYCDPHVTSL